VDLVIICFFMTTDKTKGFLKNEDFSSVANKTARPPIPTWKKYKSGKLYYHLANPWFPDAATPFNLLAHMAGIVMPKHFQVSYQRPERVGESCRSVAFDIKMRDPGETISTDWNHQNEPGAGQPRCRSQRNDGCCADKMLRASQRCAVFADIERPEIGEGFESFCHIATIASIRESRE
jgi:hypothetical protein